MNNIPENDWAEESWGGFSGMSNDSDWSTVEKNEDPDPEDVIDDKKT
jgi:hypothetical protein